MEHTGQRGGKSDAIRGLFPISNFMTLCKKEGEFKSLQNKINGDLAWKTGSDEKKVYKDLFSWLIITYHAKRYLHLTTVFHSIYRVKF